MKALPQSQNNLIWPSEGFSGQIEANEVSQVIAVLPKAFPTVTAGPNEIEKLQITLEAAEVE